MSDAPPRLSEDAPGLSRTLGYRRGDWAEDRASMMLDLDERHLNPNGMAHGGVYATLIDEVTGYLLCWRPDPAQRRLGVTLAMTVEFIGAPTTRRVIATAFRKGGGASIAFAGAEVRDDAGVLLATGGTTYRFLKPRA